MTKVKKLSVVLIGLVLISLFLAWVGQKDRIESVDKYLFAIQDTTQISGIVISRDQKEISIQRNNNSWLINEKYKADPQLIYLSQRILQAVETQRPISRSNSELIKNELMQSGCLVKIQLSNSESKTFYAGGNTAKTMAYFANQDLSKIYTVAIPGYKSYLSGIFELTLNQWRDRVLFASSWRTIQSFKVDYMAESISDLNIFFDDKFLKVEGVNQLDTAALVNYLSPLANFQLNDYLSPGSFSRYDSLTSVDPMARLSIKDIDANNNRELKIYPKIAGERFYLVTNDQNEMMVVDEGRMNNILVGPSQFQKE